MVGKNEAALSVDVAAVLRNKAPRLARWIPDCLTQRLAHIVHQEEINDFLRRNQGVEGYAFAQAVLKELDVRVEVHGEIPYTPEKAPVFVCNHPLGGLDGIALIANIGNLYGNDRFRFMVNDILLSISPLRSLFLPVNKHGAQSREAVEAIGAAYRNGEIAICTFPAGLCSRNTHGDVIEDLAWQRNVVVKSRAAHRDIVPLHFSGENSKFFYRLSKWRARFGLPNIEMLWLADEMFKAKGKTFTLTVGERIPWQSLTTPDALREICYSLKDKEL